MKRILKEMKWEALSTGVLYIVLGVMSLALPETMEKILGYMIGVVLIVGGAVSMISYLLRDAHQNYYHNDFLHGLIGIAAGILVLVKMDIIIGLISFMLGVLVLVSGCSRLQDVIDMKRLECGNWIIMLVIAAVNVGFGIFLICNPFAWTILLFRLLGIGLILSGVADCICTIYFAGMIRKYLDSLEAVDSTFVEVTDEDTARKGAPSRKGTPTRKGTQAAKNTPTRQGASAEEYAPARQSAPTEEYASAGKGTPMEEYAPMRKEMSAENDIPTEKVTSAAQEIPTEAKDRNDIPRKDEVLQKEAEQSTL